MNNLKKMITRRVEEHIDIAVVHSQVLSGDELDIVIGATKKCLKILVVSNLTDDVIEEYNDCLAIINTACNTNLSRIIKTITLE